jgi:cystathionine gamma-synthase
MRFETLAVHAGHAPDPVTGSVATPLYLSTTFARDAEGTPLGGHTYIRESNPNQSRLEDALASLEGGETALVFASGMAAGIALFQALPPGSHVLLPDDAYYGFRAAAEEFFPNWGLRADLVDMTDLAAVTAALRPETRLVWIESPSNPLLKVVDVAAVARIAREAGALSVLDNTFATPALQRPLALGVDVAHHSTTKYLGGHSDVQGGALIFARRGELAARVEHMRHVLGPVLAPFNAWLTLRGLCTLPCRVAWQSATALAVARFLAASPAVARVHYPGLPSHPGHDIAARQMRDFGGMVSFRVEGGAEAALRVCERARLFTLAPWPAPVSSPAPPPWAASRASWSTAPPAKERPPAPRRT